MVHKAAKDHAFRGRARHMGASMTSGGIGKKLDSEKLSTDRIAGDFG
jgi:hypothetical protein